MSDQAPVSSIRDIPGWFNLPDQMLFEFFLSVDDVVPEGDLVELGAYLGKSAVHMGGFLRPGETFTVCDLFGASAEDEANAVENQQSYATLNRRAFEENYLALRGELPAVVEALSSTILDHVPADGARFVHIDASHLFDHVVTDIDSTEKMLKTGGVVVFDDYRSPHTPGVAAAVWTSVAQGRITPVCLSPSKFYGVFGAADGHREQLLRWLQTQSVLSWETQSLTGRDVVRVKPIRRAEGAKNTADQKLAKAQTEPQLAQLTRDLSRVKKRVKRLEQTLEAVPAPSRLGRVARRIESGVERRVSARGKNRVH